MSTFSEPVYIFNQNTKQEMFGDLIHVHLESTDPKAVVAGTEPLILKIGYELVIKHKSNIGQMISEFISVNEYELIEIAQKVNDDVQGSFLDLISKTQLNKLIFISNDYLEHCETTKEEILYWANSIASFRAFIDMCNDNRALFTPKWFDGFESVMCSYEFDLLETEVVVFIEDDLVDGHKKWTEEILYELVDERHKDKVDYSSFNPDENAKRMPGLLSIAVAKLTPIYSETTLAVERYRHPMAALYSSIKTLISEDVLPKQCKNCGKYFAPTKRSDTAYCDRVSPQDATKTCKEYGARNAWERTLRESEVAGLYRKIYMSKQMLVKRNPHIAEYAESFEKYKTLSKQWKADVKTGTKTEEAFIAWLKDVKEKKVL